MAGRCFNPGTPILSTNFNLSIVQKNTNNKIIKAIFNPSDEAEKKINIKYIYLFIANTCTFIYTFGCFSRYRATLSALEL